MWGCWRSLLSCQPDLAVQQVSFVERNLSTCMPLCCQFVIVVLPLSTRAAASVRGHRGCTSTGEGRARAHPACGHRQTPIFSLCQVRVEGESCCCSHMHMFVNQARVITILLYITIYYYYLLHYKSSASH